MLGLRIKSLRLENGWTQTELAKKIAVGRTTITEYEAERIVPPYDKIIMMSDIFGVSVKYLTGESNSRTDAPTDVDDVAEQITKMIDQLKDTNCSMKFDGQIINNELKSTIASQLQSVLATIKYMNKMNKGEQ